ncbi:MAG: SpoIIE family protein phosphatase [Spirochaetales bacterium]|nr:SpoIIE family protein phosphatase [Spirochaetales bacterium]
MAAGKTGKQNNKRLKIGVLSDKLYYSLPVAIYHGLQKAAHELALDLIVFTGCILKSENINTQQANLLYEMAHCSDLDGIIVASNLISYHISQDDLRGFLQQYSAVPVVSLGLPAAGFPGIVCDNYSGLYSIIEHIIQKHKKRKIIFISGPSRNQDALTRLRAYREALENNGLSIDEALILPGDFQENHATEALRDFMDKKCMRPGEDFDAIIGVNDYSARGAFIELQKRGIKVPEDVAIAGFDDVYVMRCLSPPMTSVHVPFTEMGEKAVHVICDQIRGNKISGIYTLKSEPVIRESCGCKIKSENERKLIHKLPPEIADMLQNNRRSFLEQLNRDIAIKQVPTRALVNWEELLATLRENSQIPTHPGQIECDSFYRDYWAPVGTSAYLSFHRNIQDLRFTRISQALSSTVQLTEIIHILKTQLPAMGIHQCYLVLYDDPPFPIFPQKLPDTSKLIMAFTEDNDHGIPEEGIRFRTADILPRRFMDELAGNIIIEALSFQEDQIGYVLFFAGAEDEGLYSNLQIQISSSLQSVLMVRKLNENAKKLKLANEQIRLLNEKLNEENVEMHTEMRVAEKIQTALLPRNLDNIHPDFDISARMVPADEVGGDYYDFIKTDNGLFWTGIGDVSGHGVTPGLIMMMTQTMHSLIIQNYEVSPKDILVMMNKILQENIGNRLEENNYMTFTSLKYLGNGSFQHAGLHQDLIIYRNSKKNCEFIPTNGTWLNLVSDIAKDTENEEFCLDPGDVLVLFTDGISELFSPERKMFGPERISQTLGKSAAKSAREILDGIFDAAMEWAGQKNNDDMTLLVMKRK